MKYWWKKKKRLSIVGGKFLCTFFIIILLWWRDTIYGTMAAMAMRMKKKVAEYFRLSTESQINSNNMQINEKKTTTRWNE